MSAAALIDIVLAAAGLAAFGLAYALARAVTLPASPRPAPATQDLGQEPPAVVSMLVNRWTVTEDAVESTLLDLAARGHLEIRQPGADPTQTTLHVRESDRAGLEPYERRVLDRVDALAVGAVLPVTALTFRNEAAAKSWNKRVRAEVVSDARRRGLSRRRFTPTIVGVLVAVAAVAALAVAVAVARYTGRTPDTDDDGGPVAVGIFAFLLLAGIAAAYPGERDTPAGREVAARWLGVRDWLRGHEAFADLPPASVAVWDRYLGYGAAVGATRATSAVLDLGMGNRRLVWSSFGGTWHRVRVRYPKLWRRYGQPAGRLAVRGVLAGALGYAFVRFAGRPREVARGLDPDLAPDRAFDLVERIGVGLGVVLLCYGGYLLLRTLVDLATPRAITGEVLWQEVWRTTSGGENSPPRPILHYLAVDDGTADCTTAWGLPASLSGQCHDGDTVTLTVRRWSRRVLALSVVGPGRARALPESTVDDTDPDNVPSSMLDGGGAATVRSALRAPDLAVGDLVTVEEVSHALGLPVRAEAAQTIGPAATTTFVTVDRGRTVLLVQVVRGGPGRLAWRANARGTAVPGMGDGAYVNGDRAVLRAGEHTVLLTLMREGKGRQADLPWLLAQAAARLT